VVAPVASWCVRVLTSSFPLRQSHIIKLEDSIRLSGDDFEFDCRAVASRRREVKGIQVPDPRPRSVPRVHGPIRHVVYHDAPKSGIPVDDVGGKGDRVSRARFEARDGLHDGCGRRVGGGDSSDVEFEGVSAVVARR
jgi:hypothetical protein